MITISHPDPTGSRGGEGADIHVDAQGNLALADELPSVELRVLERLRFWRSEWFLAFNDGVPYLTEIFQRPVSVGLASSILTNEVLNVEEVTGVLNVEASIDPATRTLFWSATVSSTFGDVQVAL